nr:HK97 gp10 family phage protein [Escherichia coli]
MRPAGVWKFSVGWEGKNDRNPAGFSGLEDISRDLQLLSGAENNRVLREATRAGANVLKEEVVSRAPVRRGKLRRNVVVLSRRSRDGGMESGVHIRGVNPDTGNSDNTMKADNPRNAFYWRFVEMGTVNMPPHPFVRPAFDVRSEQAAQVAIARMNRAIDEVLRR